MIKEVLQKITRFFQNLNEKNFYKYLAVFLCSIILIGAFMIFRYYRNREYYTQKIATTNDLRQEVRTILEKAQRVKREQIAVNRMLEQEPDFKIRGYFEQLIATLGLPDNKQVAVTTSQVDRDDQYRESILNAKFVEMNMKQLAELLQEIEKNRRIYAKELEITKSKKRPKTIEVSLTIATLDKKAATI
jgi:hypothetical protein